MKNKTTAFKSIPKSQEVYCSCLAGVKYADAQRTKIKAGDKLELFWERNNPFDANAIRVELNKVKLGYIRAADTHLLHAHRKSDIKLRAFVRSYHPTNPSWQQIVIVVYADKVEAADTPL